MAHSDRLTLSAPLGWLANLPPSVSSAWALTAKPLGAHNNCTDAALHPTMDINLHLGLAGSWTEDPMAPGILSLPQVTVPHRISLQFLWVLETWVPSVGLSERVTDCLFLSAPEGSHPDGEVVRICVGVQASVLVGETSHS